MILTVMIGLSVSCLAFDNTGNTQCMDDLQLKANSYYDKIKGATTVAESMTYNAVKVYVDRIDVLRQETARDTTAEMELEYKKGRAIGILSWIYYSHAEEAGSIIPTVSAEYERQKNIIDKGNLDFFEGSGVNACYTNLLNLIYTERIEALRATDNGNGLVSAIVDNALKLVPSRCAYSESFGEDAENCRIYYAEVYAQVKLQQLRNGTIGELAVVVSIIRPDGELDMSVDGEYAEFFGQINSSELKEAYISGAVGDGEVIRVLNEALYKTVAHLLTPEESFGAYKKDYHTSLIRSMRLKVEAANSQAEVEQVSMGDLFSDYSAGLLRAEAKDELSAYADPLGRDTAMNIIILEYTGLADGNGILDGAKDGNEVAEALLTAKMRCFWYDAYRKALVSIEELLGEGSDKYKEARALYVTVDGKIKTGERSRGEVIAENLSIDTSELQGIIIRAEAERFTLAHKDIIEKSQVSAEDKTALSAAIADSATLSAEAQRILDSTLSDIGGKYKALTVEEINSFSDGVGAEEHRQSAAKKIRELVEALSLKDKDGRYTLCELKTWADIYVEKAKTVCDLFDDYAAVYLSGGADHFGKDAEQVATIYTSEIISVTYGKEAQKKAEAVLELKRLASLERIFKSAEGYESVGDIPTLLENSRNELTALSDDAEINSYAAEKIAEISEEIRVHELKNATDGMVVRYDEIKNKISGYQYMTEEERTALLSELENILTSGQSEALSAADGGAVKSAFRDALAKFSLLEDKAQKEELDSCLEGATDALRKAYGKREDYSEENWARIEALIAEYSAELEAAKTVAEYVDIRDRGVEAILQVEDLAEAAKREGEERISAVYLALMERKYCYSTLMLSRLEEIYEHSVAELTALDIAPENAAEISAFAEERVTLMRGVPLERIYTADGAFMTEGSKVYPDGYNIDKNGYIGELWSQDGIPSNAELIIKRIGTDGVVELIRSAARASQVLIGGDAERREAIKSLRYCNVVAGVQMTLGNILPEGGCYRVSILLPDSIDSSDVFGVVFVRDDGAVEFFPVTPDGDILEFETSHFSKYYVVSTGSVNLIPLIVCLCIIILCELCVLVLLLIKRRKRQIGVIYSFFPIPFALAVGYKPAGGNLLAVGLGVVVLSLGVAIGYLSYLEIRAAKRQKHKDGQQTAIVQAPKSVHVTTSARMGATDEDAGAESHRPPMESVSVEVADTLMSDSEALRLQREETEGYEDTEIYHGEKKSEVNIDTISQYFSDGETVTLNSLKDKKLIPQSAGQVKILARGVLDKRLRVVAQDFSRAAVKMILLTGGEAIITYSSSERGGKRKF